MDGSANLRCFLLFFFEREREKFESGRAGSADVRNNVERGRVVRGIVATSE